MTPLDLTNDERDLILAGVFELTMTNVEDDATRERCNALAVKLGGDATQIFFEP